MSDLISRQDAIDAIRKFQTYKLFEKDNMLLVDQAEVMTELMMLPSAEPQWIPVSERLPIPPTFCLVTTDGSHGDVIDIALYMSDGWHKASEVLAWMPLPPPYEGDDEHERTNYIP